MLDLFVIQRREDLLNPPGKPYFHVERSAIASKPIGVAQAGKDLVLNVPGRPQAVQIEAARADHTLAQLFEALFAINPVVIEERPDIPITLGVLDVLKFRNHVIGALLEASIPGGGIHQANRRQVMSRDMTSELSSGAVPTAVSWCFRI